LTNVDVKVDFLPPLDYKEEDEVVYYNIDINLGPRDT